MEELAQALGLTVTQLLSCEAAKEDISASPQTAENVSSLLDIASESNQRQRKKYFRGMIAILSAVMLTVVVLCFCMTTSVHHSAYVRYFGSQTKNGQNLVYMVYMGYDDTLLPLVCQDTELFETIASGSAGQAYHITYRWNRFKQQGFLVSCEAFDSPGSIRDQQGGAIGVDSLLGIDCVWMEYLSIYPARNGEQYLYDLRLYYEGDGRLYFADTDETTDLLTIRGCQNIASFDDDGDGIVELFVWTKYDRAPYIRYDTENGQLLSALVDKVPAAVLEMLQKN